jgi:WhiB family transcriptional regulator, redox-sensing transcriptional regulator
VTQTEDRMADTVDWRTYAACRLVSPDFMFPDPGRVKDTAQAKSVCTGCPVQQPCLEEAMWAEEGKPRDARYGVRGGLSPGERYALRKKATRAGDDRDYKVPTLARSTVKRSHKKKPVTGADKVTDVDVKGELL